MAPKAPAPIDNKKVVHTPPQRGAEVVESSYTNTPRMHNQMGDVDSMTNIQHLNNRKTIHPHKPAFTTQYTSLLEPSNYTECNSHGCSMLKSDS